MDSKALRRIEAQKRAENRRQGRLASHREVTLIREYIKTLVGKIPWIEHIYQGRVTFIDKGSDGKPTGACLVDYKAANGKPTWALHGDRVPILNESYALFYPSRGATPWIEIPTGKYLYWEVFDTDNAKIYRMPWPPSQPTDAELLCTIATGFTGESLYRKFIGCDGIGNLWFHWRNGSDNEVSYWPDNGKGIHSQRINIGERVPGAVDCTPGQSNIIALEMPQVTETEHYSLITHSDYRAATWIHLQDDNGTTFEPGPPGPDNSQYYLNQSLNYSDFCLNGSDTALIRSEGHYVPPNDGTSDTPHAHYFAIELPPPDPSAELSTGPIIKHPRATIWTGRNSIVNGSLQITWLEFASVDLTGEWLRYTYGIRQGEGFAGFPDEWVTGRQALEYILSASGDDRKCVSDMYHDVHKAFPAAHYENKIEGIETFYKLFMNSYHPHIWTEGESKIVAAWPFVKMSHHTRYNGPDFVQRMRDGLTLATWTYYAETIEFPGIDQTIPSDPAKFFWEAYSVGPDDNGNIRISGKWNHHNKPRDALGGAPDPGEPDAYFFGVSGDENVGWFQENDFSFLRMFADGRNGADLCAIDTTGKYWVSEDAGANWKLMYSNETGAPPPRGSGYGIASEGFIVEG